MSKLIFLLILSYSLTVIVRCTRSAICELPHTTGPCRGMFPSFYFNPSTNQCKEFIYGGCEGNANRFENEEECMAKCSQSKHSEDQMKYEDE
ncbi:hypothetical protein I4U23_025067 [Adineta vaga]|nr:hypothetical protein I4U23_025067 [Adineta vaga]